MSTESTANYGVHVVFIEKGVTSRKYTYKSTKAFPINSLIVVRTPTYFAAGKVVGCEANFKFDPSIKYRGIYANLGVPK